MKKVVVECDKFEKECDDTKPCDLIVMIFANLEHGDELCCNSGVVQTITWADEDSPLGFPGARKKK